MIHTVLTLDRPLIVFDLETTSSRSEEAKILEIGFQLFTAAGLVKEWRTLVNPGTPIPPEVTKIHGITDDMVRGCRVCGGRGGDLLTERAPCSCEKFAPWPAFIQIAPNVAKGFSDCDFAGKNIRYDLRVMATRMAAVGVPWSYAGARIICADRLEQLGEPRDLTTLYKRRTGKDLEDAHSAMNDVRATTELIVAQLQLFTHLPRDVHRLHELSWPDWCDSEGKFRWKNDEVVITFGKHNGASLRKLPRDYLKWMTEAQFPDDVKKIAGDAMSGRFPQKG